MLYFQIEICNVTDIYILITTTEYTLEGISDCVIFFPNHLTLVFHWEEVVLLNKFGCPTKRWFLNFQILGSTTTVIHHN